MSPFILERLAVVPGTNVRTLSAVSGLLTATIA